MSKILLDLVIAAALFANLNGGQAKTDHQYPKIDTTKIPEWQATASAYGGKLLLSDSPETVTDDGILYQDNVTGSGRVFFHHVNGSKVTKKFAVVLENRGISTAYVTVNNHGLGGPGLDYLAVGKNAQRDYMKGQEAYLIEIPPKGAVSLFGKDITVQPDMLVSGIYDFKADQNVTLKVVMAPRAADTINFAGQANVLPPDVYRLRGTFDASDLMVVPTKVYNAETDGTVAITLADNVIDKYLTGIDATNGTQVINYGNYGVVYNIFMPTEGNKKLDYYLNPWGGSYAGAMGVKYKQNQLSPVNTPDGKLSIGENTLQSLAFLGSYQSGESLWFTFSPPGSSNLPVRLLVNPQDK